MPGGTWPNGFQLTAMCVNGAIARLAGRCSSVSFWQQDAPRSPVLGRLFSAASVIVMPIAVGSPFSSTRTQEQTDPSPSFLVSPISTRATGGSRLSVAADTTRDGGLTINATAIAATTIDSNHGKRFIATHSLL